MSEHNDLAHFLSIDSIVDNTVLPDTAVALAHEPPAVLVDDLFPPKPLTLSWSDEFHLNSQDLQHPTPPTLQLSPPPWNNHYPLPWPNLHYDYSSQYPDDPAQSLYPPPLSVPSQYNQSDVNSAPASASYSSSPLSSSPFSIPPSPLPPAFDPHSHQYVHPSDLSAPATTGQPPDLALTMGGGIPNTRITVKCTSKSPGRPKQHLPAPATRSRIQHTRDAHDDSRDPQVSAQTLRGEKRKCSPSHPIHVRKRTRSTRLRSGSLAQHALQNSDDMDQDENKSEDPDNDDNDSSYSTSSSSYSPSPPSSPGPTHNNPNYTFSYTRHINTHPPRAPRVPNGPLPLPVPVPNLTKKSRGRKVPSAPNNYGPLAGTSAVDDDANSSNGNVDGRRARGYMCRVPGCGKCFIRGEHLKRHVRSIHTYEKPHACPHEGCEKTFSRRDNLAQHLRVHR